MKKIPILPNVITAFGLTCGLFVIFKMNMTGIGVVTADGLAHASLILLLAVGADLLDGFTARIMKAESTFGSHFDTLADAISFGVAPCVVVLKTLSATPGTEMSFLLTFASMTYAVSGILRLIRFNLTSEDERGSRYFEGLPIPGACCAVISLNLFLLSIPLPLVEKGIILSVCMICLGYLMVSKLLFPSLKKLQVKVSSFRVLLLTVLSCVFIFFGILNNFILLFFSISWGYILYSLFHNFWKMMARPR